jgi:hypothetical protein
MTGALLIAFSVSASATTYYVSSSTGNDANNGTSAASAWQTIGHVNGQAFLPGDSILFKRGDVWNESLEPLSSGSPGNPIAFDAYGTGPAPNLTGYYSVPASAWIHVSGNAWKAPLPTTYSTVNFCLFGSVWGQKVTAVASDLTAQGNFYFANGYVYVYAPESPNLFYSAAIVPMALSNVPVINVNGQTWLTFQHFLINWFDQYGVYVQGTSDHLVLANMESDSMIPQGTQPLGFYVNESEPGPGDIKIYNDEAHLNYDGFRFDGTATAITMVNGKSYANRDGALVDNTGAVTFSYCHFYASSLAVATSTDVEWTSGTGPTAGPGNIAIDTAPAVQVWERYPAMVTLTVDDSGMTPGADSYYADTVLPVADAAGVPVGAAITVGYPLAQTLISEFQSWINAGRDVAAHSISHTYYTNTDALDIQYIGSGTAATLNVTGNVLTITVTGASDSVSYNLAEGQPQGTMLLLAQALAATGKYTYSFMTPCQGPYGTGCAAYTAAALLSQDLANVSGQDVKSAVYHMQLDVTKLTTDEITLSRQWMTTNLTGLPATPVYVYPGGYETTTMQGITEGVPYRGARGALKEDLGVKDTYADGFNVENITSFGVNPTWMGIPPTTLNQHIQALVWKEQVWGAPWGIFWHLNELTQDDPVGGSEITNLIQDFKASGATIDTNTGLVNWLLSGTQETGTDGNDYYTFPANGTTLDFRPTKNSPVVDAGQNLGPEYELDINGINQNSYGSGWEIGAHVYEGYTAYGGGTGSWFTVGNQQPAGMPELPQIWVNNNECNPALVAPAYTVTYSSSSSWSCGGTSYGPYAAGSCSATNGLQRAVNDLEACRTVNGGVPNELLIIPTGASYNCSNSDNGLTIPQSSNTAATGCIALISSADSNLPNGQVVGAHGIQDNLATSTDIGLHNPDLTGQNMYDEEGPALTAPDNGSGTGNSCVSASMLGTIATFTLVSGTNCATTFPASFTVGEIVIGSYFVPNNYRTRWQILSGGAGAASLTAQACTYASSSTCSGGLANTTTYGSLQTESILTGHATLSANTTMLLPVSSTMVAAGSPVLIPLANGYISPGNSYVIDNGLGTQETVSPTSGPNQTGIYAVFSQTHNFGATVQLCASGCNYTLANGQQTNTADYNDLQYMWSVTNPGAPFISCSPLATSSTASPPECNSSTSAPDHWLIEDMRAYMGVGSSALGWDIGFVRNGNETSQNQYPSHIHLRKVGAVDEWTNLFTGSNSVITGIEFVCVYCSIVDSQISQIMRPSSEGHAIGCQGTDYKINHNWIEGGSSGCIGGGFSGGSGPTSQTTSSLALNVIPFCDIEERRDRFTYPFPWSGLTVGVNINPNNVYGIGYTAYSPLRKIAQETKAGCRILEDGNIYENTDQTGGAYGQLRAYNPRNNAGGPQGSWYIAQIHDVTSVNNIYRHGCLGLSIGGGSDEAGGDGGGVSWPTLGVSLSNNLVYDVSQGSHPQCSGISDKYGINMVAASNYGWQGTATVNDAGTTITFVGATDNYTEIPITGASGSLAASAASGGTQAITSSSLFGNATNSNPWNANADLTFNGNTYSINACTTTSACTVICGTAGTPACAAAGSYSFTAIPTGTQAFDLGVGVPAPLFNCTGALSGANSPTTVYGGNNYPAKGYAVVSPSTPWNGSYAVGNVTVTMSGNFSSYPGLSDSTCMTTNLQGAPANVAINHSDVITDNLYGVSNGPTLGSGIVANGTGPNFQTNGNFTNSILLGGIGSHLFGTPGCQQQDFMMDSSTLTNDHLVWPGQTCSNYATTCAGSTVVAGSGACAEGGNPNFPVAFPVEYFVASMCSYWTGSSACTDGTQNINASDYHAFEQESSSPFYAGGSGAASDGTAMGVNIPLIDTGETLNTFTCPYVCGSPGPYGDVSPR